mmetsp:Transcript_35721/g.78021  ORF Transcript_35721/g.78021 Transcript_35721/m.78021 type:complete len:220 (+) Transcript_35721:579-1238(+)
MASLDRFRVFRRPWACCSQSGGRDASLESCLQYRTARAAVMVFAARKARPTATLAAARTALSAWCFPRSWDMRWRYCMILGVSVETSVATAESTIFLVARPSGVLWAGTVTELSTSVEASASLSASNLPPACAAASAPSAAAAMTVACVPASPEASVAAAGLPSALGAGLASWPGCSGAVPSPSVSSPDSQASGFGAPDTAGLAACLVVCAGALVSSSP